MATINSIHSSSLPTLQINKPVQTPEINPLPTPIANTPAKESGDKNYQKWTDAGFPVNVYHQYPDLVDFVFKNNLHYMLEYYQKNDNKENHQIIFNPSDNQDPLIYFRGQYTEWKSVLATIEKEKQVDASGKVIKGLDQDGKLKGWFYTYDKGLDDWDVTSWGITANKEPRPIRQLPPEKCPKTPVFTICTAFKNFPQPPFKESHSYIELTTPDGKVYNFGLWSPEALETGGAKNGFATAIGNLNCPDCFEFMGKRVTITKSDYAIDEAKFQKLMDWLKAKKEEGVPFNWLETNCSKFATDVADVIGIHIDIKQSPISLIMPRKVQNAARKVWKHIPGFARAILKTVSKILCIVPNIFLNSLRCLFFGATIGPEKMVADKNGVNKKVKFAVISSAKDFFFKGLEFRLPRTLLAFQKEHNKKSSQFAAIKPQLQIHNVPSTQIAASAA